MKDLKRNGWTVLLLGKLNIFTDGPERVNCFRAQIFSFPCLTVSTRRFMCNEFPITDLHQLGCQSACLYTACLHLTTFSLHVEAHTKARNSCTPTKSRWNVPLDFPCCSSLRHYSLPVVSRRTIPVMNLRHQRVFQKWSDISFKAIPISSHLQGMKVMGEMWEGCPIKDQGTNSPILVFEVQIQGLKKRKSLPFGSL